MSIQWEKHEGRRKDRPIMKTKFSRKPAKIKSPAEIYAALSAPLPPEALTPMSNGLTAINDGYVRERMNRVLGPHGWKVSEPRIISLEIWKDVEGRPLCDDEGAPIWDATVSLTVTIAALNKDYYGFGGSQNSDKGNALKGAATDAFGKAMSDLVGIEVYKGLTNAPANGNGSSPEGSQTITGTLEAAYFSAPKPWIMVSGERLFVLSKSVTNTIQRIYAADTRSDKQSKLSLRCHPEGELAVVDAVEVV